MRFFFLATASLIWTALTVVLQNRPTAFLPGTAAAAGIALMNALSNLAGFISPS